MKPTFRILTPWLCLGTAVTSLAAPSSLPDRGRAGHDVGSIPAVRLMPAMAVRPKLGVAVERVSDEMRHQLPLLKPGAGLIVRELARGGIAAKAGIEKLDILLAWNDQMLVHPAQLQTLMATAKAGDTVNLGFLHRGVWTKVEITPMRRPGPAAKPHKHPKPQQAAPQKAAPQQAAPHHVAPQQAAPHHVAPAKAAPQQVTPPQCAIGVRGCGLETLDLEAMGRLVEGVKLEDVGALLLQGLDLESVDMPKLEEALDGMMLNLEKLVEVVEGMDFDINRIGKRMGEQLRKELDKKLGADGSGLNLEAINPDQISRLLENIDPEALGAIVEAFSRPQPAAAEGAPAPAAAPAIGEAKIILIGPGGNRTEFSLGEAMKPGGNPQDALKSLDFSKLNPMDLLGGKLLLVKPDGSQQEINPAELLQKSDAINQFLEALGNPK